MMSQLMSNLRLFNSLRRPLSSSQVSRVGVNRSPICATMSRIKDEGTQPLTLDLINHLERTSLVEFGSEEALTRLQEAINFANVIFEVDTSGVEPMTSVLDDSALRLREDVEEPTCRKDILMNASILDEDYFVSPPGNVPLTPKTKIEEVASMN